MTREVHLGFTGDVMLGRLVNDRYRSGPPERVWGTTIDRLQQLDGLFINLECCLSTRGTQWTETNRPFHFRANPDWAVPSLTHASVDWTCLANNHILDYEAVALEDTIRELNSADIAFAGAGANQSEARTPAYVTCGDLEIGVVAFTDNTPEYAAGPDSPGTARIEMDPGNDTTRTIVREVLEAVATRDPDLTVASLHWGPNMVEYPASEYERFGKWLLAEGVDIVHGHSAHVFQGIEVTDSGVILYDTGDFVDDYAVDRELRNDRSFLFEFTVTSLGELTELRLQPVEIVDCAVHIAKETVADWCRERMRDRSERYGTSYTRSGEELVVDLG